ncbi:hypothetical protein MHU86_7148 [Fragilaria crotonensis]|nr:hypothetical protein MHU86_7148 [Fragilaria crotonensis]
MADLALTLREISLSKGPQMEEAGQIMMKNTDTIIPEGVEAEVLKYLKFEDLNHQDVFTGNLIFSEKSIYQYMGETNFDEPIRYIFRDFDSAGVDDGVRLENIKALMKNKNFKLFLDKSNAVVKLVLSFPHHDYFTFLDDDDIFDMFLDWLELQWDSPEKEFILANQNDLSSILSRGCRTYDSSWVRTYHHMLPPALADIVNQLIKRGDQDAADFLIRL